jgi:chemotaxis methyl-accepting protein methylase
LNVVWQREELEAGQRYDLVIATNVLVYYNEFEQALALDNVQSMLRGGGFLLTNNGLPEVSTLKMKQLGHSTSVYSERSADGDHIIWYQRAP